MKDEAPRTTTPAERRIAFRLLFVCLMTAGVGNSIVFAVLPPLASEIGLTDMMVSIIYVAPSILFIFASQAWGAASDRLGRRPVVLLGLAGSAASMIGFAAVAPIATARLISAAWATALFTGSRMFFAGFGSGSPPAAQAYVADRTEPAQRTAALATLGAGFGLGAALGPTVEGALAPFLGLTGPLYVTGAFTLATLVATRMFLPERTPPKGQGSKADLARPKVAALALDPRLRAITLIGVLTWTVQAVQLQTIGFFVMDRIAVEGRAAATSAGWALTIGALALLFAQVVIIRVFRLTPRMATIMGAAVMAIGSVILTFAGGMIAIIIGFAVASTGAGLSRPGQAGVGSLAVTPAEQGAVAGLAMAAAGVGFLFAPIAGLLLRDGFGPAAPYAVGAVLSSIAALLAVTSGAIARASANAL